MWQLYVTAGVLWVAGSLVTYVGWWVADKTTAVPMGAVLVSVGSAMQFTAILAITTN